MVQKKAFIDSAMPALEEMCFPSILMDENVGGFGFLVQNVIDGLPCVFEVSFAGSNFVSEILLLKLLI